MAITELIAKLRSYYSATSTSARNARHPFEGWERVTTPPVEASSYEFMMENLIDTPTEEFDRWRNRMPQG